MLFVNTILTFNWYYAIIILGGDIVKNEVTNMTLRLPNDLKEKLKEKAEAQQRSLHNLIIIALTEYANKR